MQRAFEMVDMFSLEPYRGNPLAVVVDAEGLSTEDMLRITCWFNLSESAFLLASSDGQADYRVRIFTLSGELPFAGHPTLGSCHVWLRAGGRPARDDTIVQECGAGPVRLRRTNDGLAFEAPPLVRSGPVDDLLLERLAAVLGVDRGAIVDGQWVDNGPGWVAVLLPDAESVLADEPDVGFYPPGSPSAYEVRALFHDERGRLIEDPVTGSLNASVAQWLVRTGRVEPPYVVSQGTRLGRTGRPRIDQDGAGTIRVGGGTTTLVAGTLEA